MKKLLKFVIFILIFMFLMNFSFANERMKGLWIATVVNIDFPSKPTKNIEEIKLQTIKILDDAKDIGLNTVFLQVRPTADAFYNSKIFPISKYLTGIQGDNLTQNFDVLDFWIKEAHKRGLKIHAWINPYRITKSENGISMNLEDLSENNPAKLNPDICVKFGNDWYFDPGYEKSRNLIISGIQEIIDNYDVDGIHFDDYFYPSPKFNDNNSYEPYKNLMSLEEYRVNNVNQLLKDVHQITKQKGIEFGVSPFAIWKNKSSDPRGSATNGMETYYAHYADCYSWVKNGYLDYIMPQIYFEMGHKAADFIELSNWWNELVKDTNVDLYFGLAAYKSGKNDPANVWYRGDQLIKQLEFDKSLKNVKGEVFFSYRSFNLLGVKDDIKNYYSQSYPQNANNSQNTSNDSITEDKNVEYPQSYPQNNNDNQQQKLEYALNNTTSENPSLSINKKMPTAIELLYGTDYLKVFHTNKTVYGQNYVLEGICNSKKPLYMNGKLISSWNDKFTVNVNLKNGINYFGFKNGDSTYSFSMKRVEDFDKDIVAKFTVKDKLYPQNNIILQPKSTIMLSCVAPKKSFVKANIGNDEYVLEENEDKNNFNHSIYTKQINLIDLDTDFKNLGRVKYKIAGLGFSFETFSNGEISIVKAGKSPFYVMINDENPDTHNIVNPGFGKVHLMQGNTIDRADYKNDNFVFLSTGYKVINDFASVFVSETPIVNTVKFNGFSYSGNKEILSFNSDYNVAVIAEYTGLMSSPNTIPNSTLEIRVPLTNHLPDIHIDKNSMIKSIKKIDRTSYSSYYIEFKNDNNVNGYVIDHNKNGFDIVIYKHKVVKNKNYPLAGIVVMLDPGHGGADTGAIGVVKDYEKNVVLSVSYILKQKLETLGATVYMTRYTDMDPYLYNRLRASYKLRPDLFMSIHADATGNSNISGSSVHIVHEHVYPLAKMVRDNIISYTGNNNRGVRKNDFYVVRGNWCQSMLVELGFMTNKEQNLWLLDKKNQDIEATAIVDAIREFYSK